jgi:hypothetical protein
MNDNQPDHLPFAVEVSVPAGEIDKRLDEMQKFVANNWPTSQATVSRGEKDRESVVVYFADEGRTIEFATQFNGQIIKRP